MKLVFKHYVTDDCTYGYYCIIPFEFISKEDFVLDILSKIEEIKKQKIEYPSISILGIDYINLETAEQVEFNVFTLEEWFEKEKVTA